MTASGVRARWPVDQIAVAALLAILAFALGALSLTWRLDRTLYDIGLGLWPRVVADDIVIVAIDDESVQAIGRWPWRRSVHATLLERIAAARPKAIALDLLLSEPDPDPSQDEVLGAALQRAAPVIVPVNPVFLPQIGTVALLPAASLRGALRLAQADVDLDADGILRHGFMRAGLGEQLLPHMAVAMMDAAGETLAAPVPVERAPAAGGGAQTWRRDQRFLLRFAGPAGAVPRIPYVHLLRGDVAATALSGKYVLIGLTATGLGDGWPTPVSGLSRSMQGVEVVGQVLDSLRAGDTIRQVSPAGTGVISALLTIALLVGVQATGRAAPALTFGAAVAATGASLLLIHFGVWIGPSSFVVAAVLAYPLWSWRRLEQAVRVLDGELARLEAEPDAVATTPAPPAATAGDSANDFLSRRLRAVRAATLRLRRARRFLGDSLNALPVATLVTGGDGSVLAANERAAALFGAEAPPALYGVGVEDLLTQLIPAQADDWGSVIGRVRAKGTMVAELARRRQDRPGPDRLLVHLARPPSTVDDGPGLIVSIADVSELKRAEAKREEALAFVSHDLRSPAASIAILAEAFLRGNLPTPPDELMAEVKRLAQRTLDISEAFVQVSRAEVKPLVLQRLDAQELVDEAVNDVAPQARDKRVVIERGGRVDAAPIDADRALVQRAVVNLLNNAVKFSPPGKTVSVSVAARDGFCVIGVRDQGPGIAEQGKARLFTKFQRVDDADAEAGTGVGLGLVFVDQVARRHGGRVQVDTAPGRGALFELLLPAAAEDEPSALVGVALSPRPKFLPAP